TDREPAAKTKAGNAARAADLGRILRQRILIRADLQPQASAPAIDADIGSSGTNQCDAMHEGRRRVASGPGSAEGMPLKNNALTAKIDDRDGGGVIHANHSITPCGHFAGVSANALCTTPAVRICGNTTGSVT